MTLDDRELARRFPAGDPDIVRAVYERFGRAVHTVAMSILNDPALAADVVQATFLNAWRSASRFDPDRALGPWLYTIARRQSVDAYRRERRLEPVAPGDLDRVPAGEPPSFEHAWEAWQVRLALDRLAPDEREVVMMTWFEGLTHVEAAERAGVPVGTIKSRSHRAHQHLATLLEHLDGANRTEGSDVLTTRGPTVGGVQS